MKSKISLIGLPVIISAVMLANCSGLKTLSLNSVQLTNELKPGMTLTEVEGILGKPRSTHTAGGKLIARWNLQEIWRGYIPYDMVFTPDDQKLVSWGENSEAFDKQQENLQAVTDELDKNVNQQSPASSNHYVSNAPSFQNDATLMKYFAGSYYSFSAVGGGQTGGTERKISLCPDGQYYMNAETGYSGNDWGSASTGGGSGTWRITGTRSSGTIVTTSSSGVTTTYKYEVCGDGCIYFGNNKFAYAGAPQCR